MRWTCFAMMARRSFRGAFLAALLVAAVGMLLGCGPLATLGERSEAGSAAGETRRVTILYTGYGQGTVDATGSGCG